MIVISGLETSVVLTYPHGNSSCEPEVVPACGLCFELLRDMAPCLDVIVLENDGPVKVSRSEHLK